MHPVRLPPVRSIEELDIANQNQPSPSPPRPQESPSSRENGVRQNITFWRELELSYGGDGDGSGGAWPFSFDREAHLGAMPNEVLFNILSFLDVNDLLSTSRTNHHLRILSIAPILQAYRLRYVRAVLPPLITSRPSLDDLVSRSIFLTRTTVVSRRLGRSLISIRLARRLAARPSPEALVERAVLPPECVPGMSSVHVAPSLVAKRRAIEKERVKDGLRRWVGAVWKGQVLQREEDVRQWEERRGIGRVWRLRRFWERLSRGERVI